MSDITPDQSSTLFAELTRRLATEQDVPFLLALRHQSMDQHLTASGASTSEAEHLSRLMYRFDCAEVLLRNGVPAGLLKVARDPPEWKIIQIQFMPELQGKGLGALLLNQVISEAKAANVALVLTVLKANPAKGLYERLGFVVDVEGEDEFEYRMRYGARQSKDSG
jgi:ribosomal protein S18 acetylase RimI-like enzyme